jgi:thiamine transport system substrate-binding protein
MKKLLIVLFLTLLSVSFASLVVYSYDSFLPVAESAFYEFTLQTGIEVEFRTVGDSGTLISLVLANRERFDGDVIIGIDNLLSFRAFREDIFIPYIPRGYDKIISPDLLIDPQWRLTPYDFGAIAIIYDSSAVEKNIDSMWDLTDRSFRRSIIIQDPRTSSTGQAFLLWTYLLHGERFEEFWRAFKPSILTITLGWGESFQKFESGEAPIMVSYATDGAYSTHYYGEQLYAVLIPEGKGYVQIEGAGIVRWTDKLEEAQKLIDFLLTESFQKHIPLNQWMFPVIDLEMPEVFDHAVRPESILKIADDVSIEELIAKWEEIIYER